MSDLEMAWAAGFFEGEGSISASSNKYKNIILQCASTDYDVMHKFYNIVKVGRLQERHQKSSLGNKPLLSWWCTSKDARYVMAHIYVHLGERRQKKWADVIELRKQWEESR